MMDYDNPLLGSIIGELINRGARTVLISIREWLMAASARMAACDEDLSFLVLLIQFDSNLDSRR
jgi:hypothetical protein